MLQEVHCFPSRKKKRDKNAQNVTAVLLSAVWKYCGCCIDKGKRGLNLKTKGLKHLKNLSKNTFVTNVKRLGRGTHRNIHFLLSAYCLPTLALARGKGPSPESAHVVSNGVSFAASFCKTK